MRTKSLLKILAILAFSFGTSICEAQTFYAKSAHLGYDWVRDSTYMVRLHYYQDCVDANVPDSLALCYSNTCGQPVGNFTTYLHKQAFNNGLEVGGRCTGIATQCTNPASTILGQRDWLYEVEVTLPTMCDFWTFRTLAGARKPTANLQGTGDRYLEATLNNLVAPFNSSPLVNGPTLFNLCINQPTFSLATLTDPNGDSMTFELVHPFSAATSCGNKIAIPFVFNSQLPGPAIQLPNNPLQTNYSYYLNPVTGTSSFTPTAVGMATVAMIAKEYRNGTLIGSTIFDHTYEVQSCVNINPSVHNINFDSSLYSTTIGQPLNFCFTATSANANSRLEVTSNVDSLLTKTGELTDTLVGCISWTPRRYDTGQFIFTFAFIDRICDPYQSVPVTYVESVIVRVADWPASVSTTLLDKISISPNPANSQLTVKSPTAVDAAFYAMDGRVVLKKENATVLDIRILSAGIYLLRLNDSKTGVVLKQEKITVIH